MENNKTEKITWTPIKVKLGELKAWADNPRLSTKKQAKKLLQSFDEFGQVQTIAVSPDLEVYDGHQRLSALMTIYGKEYEIDARQSSRALTDGERRKLVIYLHTSAVGSWDWDALANWDASEIIGWGMDSDALKEWKQDVSALTGLLEAEKPPAEDAEPQIDKAEELRQKWGVETGQLWQLGEHRLLCGDCTKREDVERVMGGEKAKMAVTSPPYGVGKSYETKGIGPWYETIRPCIQILSNICDVVCWQLGDLYSTGSQYIEPTMAYSLNMFSEYGMKPIWIRVWEKQGMNFGVGPYHLASNKPVQQYEYITAVGKDDDGIDIVDYEWVISVAGPKYKYVRRLSQSDRRIWGYSGVWKINTVVANKDHPAMFPLELPERCIKMHSDKNDSVYEPFTGSGTSIIACERLGRKCRAVEISPAYCAVAIQRWVDVTGGEPVLLDK